MNQGIKIWETYYQRDLIVDLSALIALRVSFFFAYLDLLVFYGSISKCLCKVHSSLIYVYVSKRTGSPTL